MQQQPHECHFTEVVALRASTLTEKNTIFFQFAFRKLNETSVLVDLADQLCVVLKTKIVINRSDLNILSFERDCHESNFISADDFVLNSIYVFDSTRISCNRTNCWIYWVQMSAAIRRIRNATMTLTLTAITCDWIFQAKQTLHPIMLYCDKLLFWVRHQTVYDGWWWFKRNF